MVNEVFKAFNDFMKYEGIELRDADIPKIVDMYERLVCAIVAGSSDNTLGINILFTGNQNINFNDIDAEGLESIKTFINELNSKFATFPLSEVTFNSLMDSRKLVTVFKHVHHMVGAILGFGREYIKTAGATTGVMYSFTSTNNEDGTTFRIFGFENTEGEILFRLESDSLISTVPMNYVVV